MSDDTPSVELTIPSDPYMSRGFISKVASQVSLPYKRPDTKEVERRNGSLIVKYSTTEDCLPYGRYPRLFELWACSMIKTHNECFDPVTRKLHLGSTFREFLKLIGVQVGGKSLKTIKPQLERLFACKYFIKNIADPNKSQGYQFIVAEEWNIDWLKERASKSESFDNWVTLSQQYVDMLDDNPVPVDLAAIAQLRKPMAIDIYIWLTRRFGYLKGPQTLKWEQLYTQFGSDAKQLKHFKARFKDALEEVLEVYPDARIICGNDYVTLYPSRTSVPTMEENRELAWEESERRRARGRMAPEERRKKKRIQINRQVREEVQKAEGTRQTNDVEIGELCNLVNMNDSDEWLWAKRMAVDLLKKMGPDEAKQEFLRELAARRGEEPKDIVSEQDDGQDAGGWGEGFLFGE